MTDKLRKSAAAITSAALAAISAVQPAYASTVDSGDGRTYKALAVFGIAAVAIILLVVLGRKKK